MLQCREVYFSQFWNTHNIYSQVDGGVFDALKRDNTLTPVGRALWIWNQFLRDEMVATTSSSSVRCFASHGVGRQLAVFLVNKETTAQRVKVVLKQLPSRFNRGVAWAMRGEGPADQHPVWEQSVQVEVQKERCSVGSIRSPSR